MRHGLAPRHLETALQSLVHDGILKGIRGPRGGYELARRRQDVTANDILQVAGTIEETEHLARSDLLIKVVLPALSPAELEFGLALSHISIEDMARRAESLCRRASNGRQE